MIVYLQKVYAGEYPPQQPEKKESHWVRNSLLTAGALVGTHFGAKAGLFGRHMQKFAGNNQAWIGNKLGMHKVAMSGQRSAEDAVARLNNNITGRGKEAWNAAGYTQKDRANAILDARKSGEVTMVDPTLRQKTAENNVKNWVKDNYGKTDANGNLTPAAQNIQNHVNQYQANKDNFMADMFQQPTTKALPQGNPPTPPNNSMMDNINISGGNSGMGSKKRTVSSLLDNDSGFVDFVEV